MSKLFSVKKKFPKKKNGNVGLTKSQFYGDTSYPYQPIRTGTGHEARYRVCGRHGMSRRTEKSLKLRKKEKLQ